jgi:hypothetical protein
MRGHNILDNCRQIIAPLPKADSFPRHGLLADPLRGGDVIVSLDAATVTARIPIALGPKPFDSSSMIEHPDGWSK